MHRVVAILIAATLPAWMSYSRAADTPAAAIPGAGGSLPSMQYVSTIASDEIYEALKSAAIFTTMDKEKPGSPVTIRVSHVYGHISTASSIANALLVGGTLGLLPAITNRDLVITYEILVNGSVLTAYNYSKNLTHVFNVHATDKTHGLGVDGLAWVTGTAGQFSADVARDPRFALLTAEYHFYYDAPLADTAH